MMTGAVLPADEAQESIWYTNLLQTDPHYSISFPRTWSAEQNVARKGPAGVAIDSRSAPRII